ncbi:MAG TPA: hypothetical protein VL096_09610 [Pirellulaceae bacterium]|nr:hypothetical protein [Pirellulaceae bacterium]
MAGFMQSLATINSALRTLLAFVVVSLLGAGGWYGYTTYNEAELKLKAQEQEIAHRDQRISALEGDLELAKQRVAKLETSLRLLKIDHRLAYVDVIQQGTDAGGKLFTDVEFQEIDDNNQQVDAPKQFRIVGNVVHVSGWIVKFEDQYVENADPDRGTSLFLFKSLYGDSQKPIDGFPLDKAGTRPGAYNHGQQITDFEKRIWDDFWNIASDEGKSKSLGIRSSHGETVYFPVAKGKRYKISLRADGGLSFKPDGDAPKPIKPAG